MSDVVQAKLVMNNSWLYGFTEAEGSFYLVKKSSSRIVHAFGITQKLYFIVLEAIRLILNFKTPVAKKKTHFSIDTTNNNTILNIKNYYNNNLISLKKVEFKIWVRALEHKNNYSKFNHAREHYRYIKTLRPKMELFNISKS